MEEAKKWDRLWRPKGAPWTWAYRRVGKEQYSVLGARGNLVDQNKLHHRYPLWRPAAPRLADQGDVPRYAVHVY